MVGGAFAGPRDEPDRYAVHEFRGGGGEGELWRGSITVDGVILAVAVKVMNANHLADIEAWTHRWQRQAEILRSLDHPGLVKVREVFQGPLPHPKGQADPGSRSLYLVMNWAEGTPAHEWVAQRPNRGLQESIDLIVLIADAVSYLHGGGPTGRPVLHRDIKPANVIVSDGTPLLVDFGLVRILAGGELTPFGTPAYAAPEVLARASFSTASDRFSLGATAFFLITGKTPNFDDRAQMRRELLAVRGMESQHHIADRVMTMLDPAPERRPSDTVAWARSLTAEPAQRIATKPLPKPQRPSPARRTGLVAAGALVLGAAVGAYALGDGRGNVGETAGSSAPTGVGEEAQADEPRAMPRVMGSELEEAEAVLKAEGIAFSVVEDPDADGPPGLVVQQEPGADERLEDGEEAVITVAPNLPPVPELTGLQLEGALGELEDAGIGDYTVDERPDVEAPAGVVLDQTPAPGQLARDVEIVVSSGPPVMPSVVGLPARDAITELEGLGIAYEQRPVMTEEEANGTVIAQDPEPGTSEIDTAVIESAVRPKTIYLEDLNPVDRKGAMPSGSVSNVSGDTYTRSVRLGLRRFSNQTRVWTQYDVGRDFRRFKAMIGLEDDVASDTRVTFEVFADGNRLFEKSMGLGDAAAIDLDITDALRLEISQMVTEGHAHTGAWGDARVLGLPDEISDDFRD